MLIKTDLNCNVGCVRPKNEDMVLLGGELFRDKSQKLDFEIGGGARFAAVVADGMGGHKGGEVASEYAAEFFSDFVSGLADGLTANEVVRSVKDWAQTAHRNILRQGDENPEYAGMGTTFCGLLFYENGVFSINAGDSRLYRFRGGILRQISADHSLRELTGDKSMAANQIYNSLGAGAETFVDVKELTDQLFDDDIFLVCSDGLCDMVPDEAIERTLKLIPSADYLVEAARSAGGKDNVSVILLRIMETETPEDTEKEEETGIETGTEKPVVGEPMDETEISTAGSGMEIPRREGFLSSGNSPMPSADRSGGGGQGD